MKDIFTGLDLPEEVTMTLTERIESAKKEWIEGAKNDADFIKKLRQEEAGKFFRSNEKILKKAFPDLEINEIEGEGLKRQEAILNAGIKQYQDNKDATNQELQDKYLKLSQDFATYKDDEVPKMLSDQKGQFHKRYIADSILKDSLEFETVCRAEVRPSLVDSYLINNGWKKIWDEENNTYSILTKENLKPTKDDKPLSNKDIIQLALDDAGVLQKSNGSSTESHTAHPQPGQTKKPGQYTGYAAEMRARLQNAE